VTVTVPTMLGWTSQWYAYSPGSEKVNRNSCPEVRNPESKTPVSEVAVCVMPPVFVQQTVLPAGISTLDGSKKLSPIATIVSVS